MSSRNQKCDRRPSSYQGVLRSIISSERFNSVDAEARELYIRLLVVTDRLGRMEGDPDLVWAEACPRLIRRGVTADDVESSLQALERVGLVARWLPEGETSRVLGITRYWEPSRPDRRPQSKFPGPSREAVTAGAVPDPEPEDSALGTQVAPKLGDVDVDVDVKGNPPDASGCQADASGYPPGTQAPTSSDTQGEDWLNTHWVPKDVLISEVQALCSAAVAEYPELARLRCETSLPDALKAMFFSAVGKEPVSEAKRANEIASVRRGAARKKALAQLGKKVEAARRADDFTPYMKACLEGAVVEAGL